MSRSQLFSFVGLCALSVLAACGASDGNGMGSGEGMGSESSTGNNQNTGNIQPGTLTAGDWDDNLNFSIYQSYVTEYQSRDTTAPVIPTQDRVIVKIVNEANEAIPNALVKLAGSSKTYLTAPTNSDGRLLFFPNHDGYEPNTDVIISVFPPPGQTGYDPVTVLAPYDTSDWTIQLPGSQRILPKQLDLAFVIDATGSMGDEIEYLKVEVQGIADRIQSGFQDVSIRYALVVYRDTGDQYVTRKFDFTTDLAAFKANLNQQAAGGGGDFPEAMDEAMKTVPTLQWSEDSAVRMSFLMADAPPHKPNRAAMLNEVNALRPLGVKLFPVAASGVDPEAEYLMRVGAQMTLGRYLFLTDDSGVGGTHMEPSIPCYHVQKLNDLVYRVIASELSGTRVDALPEEIIRSVGSPEEGVCALGGGLFAYL